MSRKGRGWGKKSKSKPLTGKRSKGSGQEEQVQPRKESRAGLGFLCARSKAFKRSKEKKKNKSPIWKSKNLSKNVGGGDVCTR